MISSFKKHTKNTIKFFINVSIAEGRIRVSTLHSSPDDGKALRAAIKKASAKVPAGASYRWTINTSPAGDFQLQV